MLFSRSEGAEFEMRRKKKPIAAHPLFVPTLAVWGAAFAGLAVFVLPAAVVESVVPSSVTSILGNLAGIALPLIAAAIGAALMFLIASPIRRAAIGSASDVQPIDPSAELGSESLDAPIEDAPFGYDEAEAEAEDVDASWVEDLAQDPPEESASPLEEPAIEEPIKVDAAKRGHSNHDSELGLVQALSKHRARKAKEAIAIDQAQAEQVAPNEPEAPLDLGDFVEPEATASEPAAPARAKPKSQSAIEKLREVPPQDLNLVQMVERLAIALKDNQAARDAKPQSDGLADALKTLAMYNEDGFDAGASDVRAAPADDATQREMRDALAKLQSLRGAA